MFRKVSAVLRLSLCPVKYDHSNRTEGQCKLEFESLVLLADQKQMLFDNTTTRITTTLASYR